MNIARLIVLAYNRKKLEDEIENAKTFDPFGDEVKDK